MAFWGVLKVGPPRGTNKSAIFRLTQRAVTRAVRPGFGTVWWPLFLGLVFETLVRSSMRLGRRWSGPWCVATCDLARCSLRLGRRWPVALQTRPSSELPEAVQVQAECASCAVCARACVRRHDTCMGVRPSSELPEDVQVQAECACCPLCAAQEF